MAIKIAIANQKGGVGKTTTAICLTQELLQRKYKVLLIDSDSQCNCTSFYDAKIENEPTLVDILCGDEPTINCIQRTNKGDIIAADHLLADAENMVKIDERRFTHLKRSGKSIEKDYDFVIVDTPPVIGVCLKNVLAYVDYVIVPIDENAWALDGLIDFADAIDLAQDNNPNLSLLGILIVKTKARTKKAARILEFSNEISKKLNCETFNTRIRESVACTEALSEYSIPLHEYANKSTTYQDYQVLTDEILERIKEK